MKPRIRLEVDGVVRTGFGEVQATVVTRDGTVIFATAQAEEAPIPRPLDIEGREIVEAIVAAIKEAPDSFVAAGRWITAITNAATQAIREEDQP